jgi:type IV pilus assembly protein PilB
MKKSSVQKKRLGRILLAEGCITEEQLAQALGHQKQWKGSVKLGSELIRRGYISEEDLAFVLAKQLNIPWLSLHECRIDQDAVRAVDAKLARKLSMMPVAKRNGGLTVATIDPTDLVTLDTLGFAAGMRIEPVIATSSDIRWAIARYYDRIAEPVPHISRKRDLLGPDDLLHGEEQTALERLVEVIRKKGVLTDPERSDILEGSQ